MTPTPKECHEVLRRMVDLFERYGLRTGMTGQETFWEVQDVMQHARNLERRLFKAINGDIEGVWK